MPTVNLEAIRAARNQAAHKSRQLEREVLRLRQTISTTIDSFQRNYVVLPRSARNTIKFGVFSDTQFGNHCERADALAEFVAICERERVDCYLHPGDVLDGNKVYRGHEFELYAVGLDAQTEAAKRKVGALGITAPVYFITGNHDESFQKQVGIDIGKHIARNLGWHYVGRSCGTVVLRNAKNQPFTVGLLHPLGGTAYAVAYKSQKAIESWPGGTKPDMLFIGHYHKADFLPAFRNLPTFQAGCFESQTPFMKTVPTPAHIGGWIVEVVVSPPDHSNLSARIRTEWIGFFEPETPEPK
jgi:predicted phosphodiesterase